FRSQSGSFKGRPSKKFPPRRIPGTGAAMPGIDPLRRHRYGAAKPWNPPHRSSAMPDDARRPAIDKSRLPSRHVTVGPERAPHRAFLYSMGLTEEQINQPLVGVATTWNEAAPCNIALARQAQAAKKGVAAARGTPREFTTITVTDGIAMGHQGMKSSLVSREVIADSVELTMRGHCYDAIV